MKTSQSLEEEQKKKRRQTKILPVYMQEKLMVGFVFLILLFAILSVVIFRLVQKKGEEYSRIVLGQGNPDTVLALFRQKGERFWTGTEQSLPKAKRSTISLLIRGQ